MDTDNSALEMSDEDIMNMEPEQFLSEETPPEETPELDESAVAEETEEEETDELQGEEGEGSEEDEDPETEESEVDESITEDDPEDNEEQEETSEVDYKAEYEKLMAPFKANGREMQLDNVDDALTLIKMGANYNKKMAALKPNLKVLKMLDNNGLLDEQKLSYLIDLDKKNPEAIAKLIKDSGIDPLDVDTSKETEYKPKTYTVDDKEVELDEVLDNIKESPKYRDTLEVINTKWDDASKQILANNPRVIELINAHMEQGFYDQINTVMEKERLLGRLGGLSDLEAYKQIGDQMNAAGAFKQPTQAANSIRKPTETKPKVDPKLKSRKRAAGTTKASPAKSKQASDYNPLSMSDEEFEKVGLQQYM